MGSNGVKILDRLPIARQDNRVFVGAESVRLKEAQIIVWVSLGVMTSAEWNPAMPRFPAILDTGHAHYFAIQHQHLVRWTGLRPEQLGTLGQIRHSGKSFRLQPAKLWLHCNEPQMASLSSHPQQLLLPRGIAVYPDGENYPRLPLLGLRAITSNELHLTIDGERRWVNLRTPNWRTRLLRWLA